MFNVTATRNVSNDNDSVIGQLQQQRRSSVPTGPSMYNPIRKTSVAIAASDGRVIDKQIDEEPKM